MPTLKFAVLPGDYIGPEVMTEALRVLKHVAQQGRVDAASQAAAEGVCGKDR